MADPIISSTKRVLKVLADQLPLLMPYTLWIDPCNLCNFKCVFCPTGHSELVRNRPKGHMDLALFHKIIEDLKAMPGRLKRLCLWKDGEPLLHPQMLKMVDLAVEARVADRVELSTNASLLTRDKAIRLAGSGLDRIQISVEHVHDAGYLAVTQNFSQYDLIRANVESLWEERSKLPKSAPFIQVKVANSGLSIDELTKLREDFSEICDEIEVIDLSGWSASDRFDFTLGMAPERGYGQASLKKDRIVCPFPFYALAINFEGSVSTCCVDWAWSISVGNVRERPLLDIWRGQALKKLRMTHLEDRREEYEACRSCQYMQGHAPENDLDNYRSRLRQIYSI